MRSPFIPEDTYTAFTHGGFSPVTQFSGSFSQFKVSSCYCVIINTGGKTGQVSVTYQPDAYAGSDAYGYIKDGVPVLVGQTSTYNYPDNFRDCTGGYVWVCGSLSIYVGYRYV